MRAPLGRLVALTLLCSLALSAPVHASRYHGHRVCTRHHRCHRTVYVAPRSVLTFSFGWYVPQGDTVLDAWRDGHRLPDAAATGSLDLLFEDRTVSIHMHVGWTAQPVHVRIANVSHCTVRIRVQEWGFESGSSSPTH